MQSCGSCAHGQRKRGRRRTSTRCEAGKRKSPQTHAQCDRAQSQTRHIKRQSIAPLKKTRAPRTIYDNRLLRCSGVSRVFLVVGFVWRRRNIPENSQCFLLDFPTKAAPRKRLPRSHFGVGEKFANDALRKLARRSGHKQQESRGFGN